MTVLQKNELQPDDILAVDYFCKYIRSFMIYRVLNTYLLIQVSKSRSPSLVENKIHILILRYLSAVSMSHSISETPHHYCRLKPDICIKIFRKKYQII